ncbi:MAG: alpha/beta fold hydrolase [Deltaproteobacteria bacterium]|nr:alpha/beta fold hydrolase [Deltaproteobacteria bacterium]
MTRLLRVNAHDGASAALLARRGSWPAPHPPVLFVPGFGQNRFTWEVGEMSLPQWLAEQGHPTYVLEHRGTGLARAWGDTPAPSLAVLVKGDILAAVDRIFDDAGDFRVVLIGHSLGSLTSLLFASAHPDRVAGLLSLGGGFFLTRGPRFLRALALAGEPLAWTGLARRFPQGSLPLGPIGAALVALRGLLDHPRVPFPWPVWQPRSYSPRELRERFGSGMDRTSVGVAAELRRAFAFDRLPTLDGEAQETTLSRVVCPVLLVHSATDALVPPAVGAPLPALLHNSPDARLLVVGAPPEPAMGHCDLVASGNARRHVWPCLAEWLQGIA